MRMVIILSTVVFAIYLICTEPAHAVATITVNNVDGAGEGFNDTTLFTPVGGNPAVTLGDARLLAFRHAAFLWGTRLQSDVEIMVDAQLDPLPCNATGAVLGLAGPTTAHRDFASAPLANTWHVQALANATAGFDLDPTTPDATAKFNSDVDDDPTCLGTTTWYYGLDGNAPAGQIDFVTVVVHELTHSLGFLSLVDCETTGEKLFGFDDVFSNCLAQSGATTPDFPAMTDAERFTACRAAPDLVWTCPNVAADQAAIPLTAGLTDGQVRMYGPAALEPGSSVSHFSDTLLPNELMEPRITGVDHEPGLAVSLLEDVGWNAQPPFFGTDVVFLMDLTGSTGGLIPDWVAQIPTIAQSWIDFDANVEFAVATHFDYPFLPYGNSNEWAYRVETIFDPSPASLELALENLVNMTDPSIGTGGQDTPESQYEAIFQVLTGEGRELTPPINFTDLGELTPTSLNQDSPMVIYHFTHPEVFHDRDLEPNYPFVGAVDSRPDAEIPGRTRVLAEMATQSSNNMFIGLTFISGLSTAEIPAEMLATEESLSPLAELADITEGAVYNVSSSTAPFDVELLEEAIVASIDEFETSAQNGDADGDGIFPPADNCPEAANADQVDFDGDVVGDICDNCIATFNPNQTDLDLNGRGDVCNCLPGTDADGDNICDEADLCPAIFQNDITQLDTEEDGIPNECDNCILVANAAQRDTDNDGFGNYCDPDFNNDLIVNAADLAYLKSKFFTGDPLADLDGDGVVNASDLAVLKSFFFESPGPSGLVP